MCENMVVSDGHYTESGNYSVSDEEKRETRSNYTRLIFWEKGDAR
jgi:hypothetical protein